MPPRRSKRIKTDADVEDKTVVATIAPSKTVKSRPRNVRGRRGSLADLPKMPLDVIFEVLAYMHPLDLLHLSRTSKDFRALLMSRDSAPYWKAARRNVNNLPECPSLISEPGYASLMFETHCMGCLKRNGNSVAWDIGARLCTHCSRHATIFQGDVLELPGWPAVTETNITSLDLYRKSTRGHQRCLRSELAHFARIWEKTSVDGRAALVVERKAAVQSWNTVVDALEDFVNARKAMRSNELAMLKQNRIDTIFQNLRDLGWGEELEYIKVHHAQLDSLLSIAGVKESKALSERIWNRLKPQLVEFLEKTQKERLFAMREKALRLHFEAMETIVQNLAVLFAGIFPNTRDFALLPRIREIVEACSSNDLAAKIEDLKPELPEIVASWKAEATSALVGKINKATKLHLPPDADLDRLAIGAIMYCPVDYFSNRGNYTSYPDVLFSTCRGSTWQKTEPLSTDLDDYAIVAHKTMPRRMHTLADRGFQAMKHIIETFGCDPLTATAEELDNFGASLTCSSPSCQSEEHPPSVQAIYSWRAAFQHATLYCKELCSFTLLDDRFSKAKQRAQELQRSPANLALKTYEEKHAWYCRLCNNLNVRRGAKAEILQHLREGHNIENPGPDDLYVEPFYFHHRFSTEPSFLVSREMTLKDVLALPSVIRMASKSGNAAWAPEE